VRLAYAPHHSLWLRRQAHFQRATGAGRTVSASIRRLGERAGRQTSAGSGAYLPAILSLFFCAYGGAGRSGGIFRWRLGSAGRVSMKRALHYTFTPTLLGLRQRHFSAASACHQKEGETIWAVFW